MARLMDMPLEIRLMIYRILLTWNNAWSGEGYAIRYPLRWMTAKTDIPHELRRRGYQFKLKVGKPCYPKVSQLYEGATTIASPRFGQAEHNEVFLFGASRSTAILRASQEIYRETMPVLYGMAAFGIRVSWVEGQPSAVETLERFLRYLPALGAESIRYFCISVGLAEDCGLKKDIAQICDVLTSTLKLKWVGLTYSALHHDQGRNKESLLQLTGPLQRLACSVFVNVGESDEEKEMKERFDSLLDMQFFKTLDRSESREQDLLPAYLEDSVELRTPSEIPHPSQW